MVSRQDARSIEISSKNLLIFLGVCIGSNVSLDALEKGPFSIPGNQQFLGCPRCILKHYSDYVIPEGTSWYFNQDSQQSVACLVPPQAFQPTARIEPEVKSSSTPSHALFNSLFTNHSYFNVQVSIRHRSLNYIIISMNLWFCSLQAQGTFCTCDVSKKLKILDNCISISRPFSCQNFLCHFCDAAGRITRKAITRNIKLIWDNVQMDLRDKF